MIRSDPTLHTDTEKNMPTTYKSKLAAIENHRTETFLHLAMAPAKDESSWDANEIYSALETSGRTAEQLDAAITSLRRAWQPSATEIRDLDEKGKNAKELSRTWRDGQQQRQIEKKAFDAEQLTQDDAERRAGFSSFASPRKVGKEASRARDNPTWLQRSFGRTSPTAFRGPAG